MSGLPPIDEIKTKVVSKTLHGKTLEIVRSIPVHEPSYVYLLKEVAPKTTYYILKGFHLPLISAVSAPEDIENFLKVQLNLVKEFSLGKLACTFSKHFPKILGIDADRDPKRPGIICFEVLMEYAGTTLTAIAEASGRMGFAEAYELMKQSAEGMRFLHNCDISHLDLKLVNIFITQENNCKSDFLRQNNRSGQLS